MDMENIEKLAQKVFSSNPVIVLGSGASAPYGLPSMWNLQEYYRENIVADEGEADTWKKILSLFDEGMHLEQALESVTVEESLLKKIVRSTWDCVNEADKIAYLQGIQGDFSFEIEPLIRSLFISSNKTIDIVTTNYDRIAEFACNNSGFIYATGFTPGYLQQREGADPIGYFRKGKALRTVRVWKVHGSLDWFDRKDGVAISAPLFIRPTDDFDPLIVTPGVSKYQRTYDEPFRSVMQGADRALEGAGGFLCAGFGFRDSHIEPKMVAKCREQNVPIAVLAKELTDEAKEFLRHKAGTGYVAFEESGNKTRIYCSESPDGIEVDVPSLWTIEGFTKLVT